MEGERYLASDLPKLKGTLPPSLPSVGPRDVEGERYLASDLRKLKGTLPPSLLSVVNVKFLVQ